MGDLSAATFNRDHKIHSTNSDKKNRPTINGEPVLSFLTNPITGFYLLSVRYPMGSFLNRPPVTIGSPL